MASAWEEGDTDSLQMAITALDKPVLRALEKQLKRWGFRDAMVGDWARGEQGGIIVYLGDEQFRFEIKEVQK